MIAKVSQIRSKFCFDTTCLKNSSSLRSTPIYFSKG